MVEMELGLVSSPPYSHPDSQICEDSTFPAPSKDDSRPNSVGNSDNGVDGDDIVNKESGVGSESVSSSALISGSNGDVEVPLMLCP